LLSGSTNRITERRKIAMKWLLVTGMTLAVAVFGTGAAVADYDYVDIGDLNSEDGHNILGWGPIEPEASGGTFGNVDDCRVIYAPGESETESWATLEMDFGPADGLVEKCLVARYLDGMSGTDAFDAYVNGNYIGSYNDDNGGAENWILVEFDVSDYSGICTIEFVSTEAPWENFYLYGQCAFDEITTMDCTPTDLSRTRWGSVKALYR
jgi:hypothetical protein